MRRKGPCDWAWRNNEQFICGDQEEVHVAKSRGCASLPRLFLVVTMFLRKLGSQVSCRVISAVHSPLWELIPPGCLPLLGVTPSLQELQGLNEIMNLICDQSADSWLELSLQGPNRQMQITVRPELRRSPSGPPLA